MKYLTIIFDNSPLSRLLEETAADRYALLSGLRTFAVLRVTGMNVVETANIQNRKQRTEKLRFLGEVAGSVNPYQTPNDLLADIARAYETGGILQLGDSWNWLALNNPEEFTDELAVDGLAWHASREQWFRTMHEQLRTKYESLFRNGAATRPRNAAELLKYFIATRQAYYDTLLLDIYERQTGRRPSYDEFSTFLDAKDTRGWALFWLARVYAKYHRSIQRQHYGSKVNAGFHDLDSAIYLPYCDWFVTGDEPQRRAFRMLNVLNSRSTKIVAYRHFRSRWLIG